jgi:hypothetical protein
MSNVFKTLLLRIAKLTRNDQKWVLAQLSPEQKQQFAMLQGDNLLDCARRFRHIPAESIPPLQKPKALPFFCQTLEKQPPLFVAILLEQGQFDWQEVFGAQSKQKNELEQVVKTTLKKLKPETKQRVLALWQKQVGFSEHLENMDG